jgi:homoserine dehydrogenase
VAERVGVGLIGLGTVGAAVARRLIDEWELLGDRAGMIPVLRRVAVRDLTRRRDVDLKNATLDADPAALVDDPGVQVVVEVMGGEQPATSLIERALTQGKTVVTANKLVVAAAGPRLWSLARERGAGLWFEAAVGGGLPLVALLRDSLLGDRIRAIDSIINSTTNVILTRMSNTGESLSSALVEAQNRGMAEADPRSDVDGWDATYKLIIMSWLGFGDHRGLDDVRRVGIGDLDVLDLGYAGQLGYSIKLLAHAQIVNGTSLYLSVAPTAIPDGHRLFSVDDDANAVIISADLQAETLIEGAGLAGPATASAVVSDIVNAVRMGGCEPPAPPPRSLPIASDEDVETAAYLRLETSADTEAKSLVVQALEDRGVRVADTVDKPPLDGPFPQLLVLTGAAPRAVLSRAVETIDSLPAVRAIRCLMDRLEPA